MNDHLPLGPLDAELVQEAVSGPCSVYIAENRRSQILILSHVWTLAIETVRAQCVDML